MPVVHHPAQSTDTVSKDASVTSGKQLLVAPEPNYTRQRHR